MSLKSKPAVVATLQKVPVIVEESKQRAGQRFAMIIREAHSSQTEETARSMRRSWPRKAWSRRRRARENLDNRIVADVKKGGRRT